MDDDMIGKKKKSNFHAPEYAPEAVISRKVI